MAAFGSDPLPIETLEVSGRVGENASSDVFRAYQLQLSELHNPVAASTIVADTAGDAIATFATADKQTTLAGKLVVDASADATGILATGLDIGGAPAGGVQADIYINQIASGSSFGGSSRFEITDEDNNVLTIRFSQSASTPYQKNSALDYTIDTNRSGTWTGAVLMVQDYVDIIRQANSEDGFKLFAYYFSYQDDTDYASYTEASGTSRFDDSCHIVAAEVGTGGNGATFWRTNSAGGTSGVRYNQDKPDSSADYTIATGGVEYSLTGGVDGTPQGVGDIYSDGFVLVADSATPAAPDGAVRVYSSSGLPYGRTATADVPLIGSGIIGGGSPTTNAPVYYSGDNTFSDAHASTSLDLTWGGPVGIWDGTTLVDVGPATVIKKTGEAWSAGDMVWLDSGTAQLTTTAPTSSAWSIPYGVVVEAALSAAATGTVFVDVQEGYLLS